VARHVERLAEVDGSIDQALITGELKDDPTMVDLVPHGDRAAHLGQGLAEPLEIVGPKIVDASIAPEVADQDFARAEVILKRPRAPLSGFELRFLAGQERVAQQPDGVAVACRSTGGCDPL
jgi:hypothetical protein